MKAKESSSFIISSDTYLRRAYHISGTVLDTRTTSVKRTGNAPALMDLTANGGRQTTNKQMISSSLSAIKKTKALQEHVIIPG